MFHSVSTQSSVPSPQSFFFSGDTIAAISSATGGALRMIERVSGPQAFAIASRLSLVQLPAHSAAFQTQLQLDDLLIPAWIYVFPSPRSYTGEDTVEFHIPGNPLLARMLLDRVIKAGARSAEPGEFTARAYFNGRLDLTEAEGIAATIAAGNEQELSAARRLMSGELVRRLAPAIDVLAETLALVEVGIDFVEEDVTFLSSDEVARRIDVVNQQLARLLAASNRFERISHEPVVVLAGRPNAGKSTLLNALAGHERAVASPVAGTTRDVLSAEVRLRRGMIRVVDVAGLDDSLDETRADGAIQDIHEKMRLQAQRAVAEADHLLLVRETGDDRPSPTMGRQPDLYVISKIDTSSLARIGERTGTIAISAFTGEGLQQLCAALDALCFGDSRATSSLTLNTRHVRAIEGARDSLARARQELSAGPEVVALELRQALDALGQISGKISPDDLLGRVFSAFCIGK